ncbi:unnamed protein product, partial [Dibothriocephalus latus]
MVLTALPPPASFQTAIYEHMTSPNNLRRIFVCQIDYRVLDQPRALPCGHVFCCRCLRDITVELGGQKTVKCIFCDKVFPVDNQESCMSIAYEYKAFVDLLEAGELSGSVANVQSEFADKEEGCINAYFFYSMTTDLILSPTPGQLVAVAYDRCANDNGNIEGTNIICPVCRHTTPLSGDCRLADLPRALDIDRLLEHLLPVIAASSGVDTSLVKTVTKPNKALQSMQE